MSKLTDEQKIEIVRKYQTGEYSFAKLGKEYGVTGPSIKSILVHRNVDISKFKFSNRKYFFNEHFFDKVDTEERAYFLGLMYADGYVLKTKHKLGIELQEKDKSILIKFAEIINYKGELSIRKLNDKNINWQNQYRLILNSIHMSEQLIKLGCIPNKSLILEFPNEAQVPKFLIKHFIRGMWDGDGSINISKLKKRFIIRGNLTSTQNFCEELKLLLRDILEIGCCISIDPRVKNKKTSTRTLYLSGNNQVKKFFDWLYKDATVYLERKYNKYLELKESYYQNSLL